MSIFCRLIYSHRRSKVYQLLTSYPTQIAKFMGSTWGPPGSCRPQMGPMLAPWTLLSGYGNINVYLRCSLTHSMCLWSIDDEGAVNGFPGVVGAAADTRWDLSVRHNSLPLGDVNLQTADCQVTQDYVINIHSKGHWLDIDPTLPRWIHVQSIWVSWSLIW